MSVLDLIGNRRLRKIDVIDLITELTHLGTIDVINAILSIIDIKNIRNAVITENYCRNGSFETGTTEEWTWILGTHTIDAAIFYDGAYSLKSTPCTLAVWQNIIPCYGDEVLISYYVRTDIAQNFTLLIEYSDADSETNVGAVAIGDWTYFAFAPTKHKIIQNITFYGANATAGKSFWLDRVQVIKHNLTRVSSLPAITGTLTQSTKHDSKVYAPAVFDAAASGNLVAAVANKVTKLHGLAIQAQGTVTVNLNNGSGGSSLMEWSFQAREGATIAFAPGPACWAITSVNTALYVTLSAAVQVTITAIVSSDDAS